VRTNRIGTWLLAIFLLVTPAASGHAQSPTPRAPEHALAAIVVNSLGDEGDPDPGDGICDTKGRRNPPTEYSGSCTLRSAIDTANATLETDTISFSAVGTIQPADAPLTTITAPLIIQGSGQVLDGSLLTGSTYAGLSTSTTWGKGGVTISGLTIQKFNFAGIALGDPVGGNVIENSVLRENGTGITVGSNTPNNTIRNNEIYLNTGTGIFVSSSDNIIQGNAIGTDSSGNQDKGNGGHGIRLGGQNNLVGGSAAISVNGACGGDCNLISGNAGSGIQIAQGGSTSGVDNTVRGNFIGVNRNGSAALPNDSNGIRTNGDNNSIIGNLISGNGTPGAANDGNHGIYLEAGAVGNTLQGNLIGSAINGSDPVGNYGAGVYAYAANQNIIGAASVNAASITAPPATCGDSCNLILGNSGGITITQTTSPGSNTIIGNFIGVAVDGESATGNTGNGIFLQAVTTTVASNVIAGNLGNGIEIVGVSVVGQRPSSYTTITGNHIGVGPDGVTAMPNRRHGVYINWSADNWIGGVQAGQGNIIAYNGWTNDGAGVAIADTMTDNGAVGNRILGNAIFDNGAAHELGIDLGEDGVTPNDNGDLDVGPNRRQNFPVLTGKADSTVSGVLTSTANTTYRLEFFVTPTCSRSGYGQGKELRGTLDVTTNGAGVAAFDALLTASPGAQIVTATATDPEGNTSEFSNCLGGLFVNSTGDAADLTPGDAICATGGLVAGEPECTLRAALQEANAATGRNMIQFAIPGSGTPVIQPQQALPAFSDADGLVIDGGTQPGAGMVKIDGANAGTQTPGLHASAGDAILTGLIVTNFGGDGVLHDQDGYHLLQLSGPLEITQNCGWGVRSSAVDRADGAILALVSRNVSVSNNGYGAGCQGGGLHAAGGLSGPAGTVLTASGNNGPGLDVRSNNSAGTALAFQGVTLINDNQGHGIIADSDASFGGSPAQRGSVSGNLGAGAVVTGAVVFGAVDIHHNGGWGVTSAGTATMIDVDVSYNSLGGVRAGAGVGMGSRDVVVTNNGGAGIRVEGADPASAPPLGAALSDARIEENAADGLVVLAGAVIGANLAVNNNEGAGAQLAGDATLRDSRFCSNTAADLTIGGSADLANVQSGATCDQDDDGILDSVEDAAGNGGDGNQDGVPDRQQANVASLPNAVDGRSVTVAAASALAGVEALSALTQPLPAGYTFPVGFLQFELADIGAQAAVTATLYLPDGVAPTTYFKVGPTPDAPAAHWYEFLYDGATGAQVQGGAIVLHFVDGARGDGDLAANRRIVDPGGPARAASGGLFLPMIMR